MKRHSTSQSETQGLASFELSLVSVCKTGSLVNLCMKRIYQQLISYFSNAVFLFQFFLSFIRFFPQVRVLQKYVSFSVYYYLLFLLKDIEVEESGKRKRYLELKDENSTVKVDFRVLRKSCKIRHAWARTIHTYQVFTISIYTYLTVVHVDISKSGKIRLKAQIKILTKYSLISATAQSR